MPSICSLLPWLYSTCPNLSLVRRKPLLSGMVVPFTAGEVAAEGTIGAAIRHGELVAILQSQASGIWQPVRVFMGE